MMEMLKSFFVVLCGNEGSGKSTQAKRLAEYLKERGGVLLTKEPGGDPVGNQIREILLKPDNVINGRAEILLFEANRAQHVAQVVRPALDSGQTVVTDRFDGDTFAYQIVARGVTTAEFFRVINDFATDGLRPDIYIWVDIDPAIGLGRKKSEGVETRFEKEVLAFHQRVRRGFGKFMTEFAPDRHIVVDGSKTPDEVFADIIAGLKAKGFC